MHICEHIRKRIIPNKLAPREFAFVNVVGGNDNERIRPTTHVLHFNGPLVKRMRARKVGAGRRRYGFQLGPVV